MPESLLRRVMKRGSGRGSDASLEALAAAVKDLAAAQHKQATQLKKLVDAQKESDRRWQEATSGGLIHGPSVRRRRAQCSLDRPRRIVELAAGQVEERETGLRIVAELVRTLKGLARAI